MDGQSQGVQRGEERNRERVKAEKLLQSVTSIDLSRNNLTGESFSLDITLHSFIRDARLINE